MGDKKDTLLRDLQHKMNEIWGDGVTVICGFGAISKKEWRRRTAGAKRTIIKWSDLKEPTDD